MSVVFGTRGPKTGSLGPAGPTRSTVICLCAAKASDEIAHGAWMCPRRVVWSICGWTVVSSVVILDFLDFSFPRACLAADGECHGRISGSYIDGKFCRHGASSRPAKMCGENATLVFGFGEDGEVLGKCGLGACLMLIFKQRRKNPKRALFKASSAPKLKVGE